MQNRNYIQCHAEFISASIAGNPQQNKFVSRDVAKKLRSSQSNSTPNTQDKEFSIFNFTIFNEFKIQNL
ncbi:MAG: hypothetical protein A2X61_01835 [Ignavibacteria bacterium GWB2_35_12]|nr:MAG: hypothetical protein A2X61_01835 [Ignavibacteria bacterium GWB2_35_12]OGU86949.1 MAG: hypothetical protein A2220_12500 [Ignavibacteria bacterium RIFOXYA2_FULL_35_10]OGV21992.1 MAG: hypothetical protein A2475_08185 [Ignavibacteria bacterium RIFOXYC2_FULL_35_21]